MTYAFPDRMRLWAAGVGLLASLGGSWSGGDNLSWGGGDGQVLHWEGINLVRLDFLGLNDLVLCHFLGLTSLLATLDRLEHLAEHVGHVPEGEISISRS